nr:hypothetical protein 7 [bacterium]
MAIDFPKSPAVDDVYEVPEQGTSYVWDGVSWLAGGTFGSGGGSGGFSGVERILAGSGVIVEPSDGTGAVTVAVAAGDGGTAYPGGTVARSIYDVYTGSWANAFIEAGAQGGTWVIPPGTYNITKPIVITADGTKFVSVTPGDKPKLNFDFGTQPLATANGVQQLHRAGLWAAAKFRATGIYFQWDSSRISDHVNDCLVLFQKGDTSSGQRDDMDSSVDNCTFSNVRCNLTTPGAGGLTYYGRNMRVHGCTFSSGGGSGDIRAISLSYASNADDDNPGQMLNSAGHRKNIVTNNTFHMTKKSICVDLFRGVGVDAGTVHGLLINGNMNDVGGALLRVSAGVTANATCISGNSCIRGSRIPYVQVLAGASMTNSTINGNAFGSADATKNNVADGVVLEAGSSANHITITGNTFGAPENGCIRIRNGASRVAIVGNTFNKLHGESNVAIETSSGRGTITGNVSSMTTFHTGSGTWKFSGNDN